MREPVRFRLSGANGPVGLDGPLICYHSLAEAEAAVRAGNYGNLVAGSIPFDDDAANHSLYLGWRITNRSGADSKANAAAHFRADIDFNDTSIANYLRLIDDALLLLRSPDSALEKIVIARSERYFYDGVVDPVALFERIAALYPNARSYFVEHLEHPGVYTMGASPELFLRKTGYTITMTPLAGTVTRDTRLPESEDRARAQALLFDEKYLAEHRHLVDFMVKGLAPFCADLDFPDEPELVTAPGLWHLGTPITARLLDHETPVADLVATLHPSPAVCGVPQEDARRMIAGYESAREYYGGLVGWLDAEGDCEFHMALRGLELDSHRGHLTLRAGGGVVSRSRIDTEFAETSAKLATMRRVLGIPR
ncbi:isochorismate synthase MenF [Nocardia sp. NPDC059240]|uniref:isochorismate synthase n=1 Tax=Nocardia sp. NPDC059240 TaxID=3346786 RepID=UPI0036D03F4B